MDLESRLIYRDALMLVLDKPAGIPVHAGPGGGPNLEDGFDALRFGLPRMPHLAHRLDRDTSGCLILGRHRKALARLGKLFQDGRIGKTYLALLPKVPTELSGTIDKPLTKVHKHKGWKMRAADSMAEEGAQETVTDYKVLNSADGVSLVAFYPRTGRTHQIRVHATAQFGQAILGDTIYGADDDKKRPRLYLHAARLVVPLYPNREPITITASIPPEFQEFQAVAKWDGAL